ncbi:MAG: ATP-dependent RecD-like DNA helicase [Acidobacteriia bacterium]|nr:ATP-dependent RecD-like DNA helicase [Terriglobia bacterium]
MVKHITVRMAWHDDNWNGRVCKKPHENIYCNGIHSLLSARIQREKKPDLEKKKAGKKIDDFEGYTPPCYWSCNAFSDYSYNVEIEHPFENVKTEPVKDKLKPYSVYTWPFRLSFNHSREKYLKEGKYPPDLEKRIKTFFGKFDSGETVVFFYLNYDNPISADEEQNRYVLLGCSLLSGIDKTKYYDFDDDEFNRIKKSKRMKNLPKMMWAVQIHHDFHNWRILLPYKEYLARIEEFPEEEDKLKDMRILIDENSLVSSFKYVAEELDEDKCLYLLYKIKKSLRTVEDHGFINVDREMDIIEKLIQRSWERRGIYPSLSRALDLIASLEQDDESVGKEIASKLKEELGSDPKQLDLIFNVVTDRNASIPAFLAKVSSEIEILRNNISDYIDDINLLKKLSLFELTPHQLKRIIFQTDNPFKKPIDKEEIVQNPYLLAENYVSEEQDLDDPRILDDIIDVFKIDIGMFPDRKYVKQGNEKLQNLTHKSPERLRAIIVDYLHNIGEDGDCYSPLDNAYDFVLKYPLFYREELNINKLDLASESSRYHDHFKERLEIIENKGAFFFYLREVHYAEQLVRKTVTKLLDRQEWNVDSGWVEEYVEAQAAELEQKIPDFDRGTFKKERTTLFANVLRKSFYVISGNPGSGKTYALGRIIHEMRKNGEQVTLLAPTGKATLRLKQQTNFKDAQTDDMFFYSNGYAEYLEDFENILLKPNVRKQRIDNLIIDESSMVDLQDLAVLFSLVNLEDDEAENQDGKHRIKRVILVGDERQLPPIGFGKPFVDTIDFIVTHEEYRDNYIRLETNCRQEYDSAILSFAEIFGDKSRYYEEVLDRITKGGQISEGFNVETWTNSEQLSGKVDACLEGLIDIETGGFEEVTTCECKAEYVNVLFGLHKNGHVKGNSTKTLGLDNLQMLSPYKAGYFGTLGLNELFKAEYRDPKGTHWMDNVFFRSSPFDHADKIIRMNNWYARQSGIKRLKLSNGSIGVINNKQELGDYFRRYYFTDQNTPFDFIDDDENFGLAYAITIHKAQGSDFKNVFLVIPEKASLLSRELLYTALTRSRYRLTLFLKVGQENPLEIARKRSFILSRNTSIFELPEDYEKIYHPDKDVHVRSKVEYIIYTALKSEGLNPQYEKELRPKGRSYLIHPDFTVEYNGKTHYWEHLGRLDIKKYSGDWIRRKKDYIESGLYDSLVTTDDLNGIDDEVVMNIIQDIKGDCLKVSKTDKFSKHHYELSKHTTRTSTTL